MAAKKKKTRKSPSPRLQEADTVSSPGQRAAASPGWLERLGTRPAAVVVYLLVPLLLTWPLALHLASSLPLGSEPTPTVPYFNLWTLGWNAAWITTTGTSYWNAPIFHPTPGTFAFSDPQPLTGLLASPLWLLNRGVAYNGMLLVFLALNGVAAWRFLLHRSLAPTAALVGGLLVQFLPFLTHERGVLQLQPLFGLIWALDLLWRLAKGATPRWGWALGAAIAVTFLTSEYYGLFLIVLLGPAILFHLGGLRRRSAFTGIALGLGLGVLVVLPTLWPQARHLEKMSFERSQTTIKRYSATATDYARLTDRTLLPALVPASHGSGNKFLAPGWILLILAALGAYRGLRAGPDRRSTGALVASAAVAFFLSLGPKLTVLGWAPYALAQAGIPGFAGLRSPFRLAVLVQLCLACLAAQGLDALLRRRRPIVALFLAALALVELTPQPSRLGPIPPTPEPRTTIQSPAVFIPYVEGKTAGDYLKTVLVMNALLPTRVHLVNGYSGFFPVLNSQLKKILADFPTPRGLRALRRLGVRTLLVELDSLDPIQRQGLEDLAQAGELTDRGSWLGVRELRLSGSELQPAIEYRGRWAVAQQWERNGVVLRLMPLDTGPEVFVVAPLIAPLRWRAHWTGSGGASGAAVLEAPGSFLLYEGSDYRPRIHLPLPGGAYAYRVELLHPASGEMVAATHVRPGG